MRGRMQLILQSKILPYICKRFGSVSAFKVLKYMTEFTIARKKGALTTYEVSCKIPPSEIMTRTALISIIVKVDGVFPGTVKNAITKLIEEKILRYDRQTDIIELAVDVKNFTHIYLKLQKNKVFPVQDLSEADVVLLPLAVREKICGAPDIMIKDLNRKKSAIVEIKDY